MGLCRVCIFICIVELRREYIGVMDHYTMSLHPPLCKFLNIHGNFPK